MHTRQIMTPEVVTISPDATIVEAASKMLQHHVSALPVVDAAGKLIGIISEGDFIRRAEIGTQRRRGRWLQFLVGSNRIASDFVHEHGRKVGEIMTPNPLTVTEDAPLEQVVQIMESRNIKRLPVMRGDRLVGIVSRSDFVAYVSDLAGNVPNLSADDEHIRAGVLATIGRAPWRPCCLNVNVRDGLVNMRGIVRNDSARRAAIIAAENVPGVRKVLDHFSVYPPPEEDLGGGDFVSLQEQPSTKPF